MAGQRSTRLSMLALIQEGILEPGERLLTFDYMGKRCEADLLPDGLIQWNGSKYSSPYAWASQCKNQVNPDHKSGIGWGHIRYKGIKLSQYKTVYIKKHQLGSPEAESLDEAPMESKPPPKPRRRKNVQLLKEEPVENSEATGFKSPTKVQSHSMSDHKDVLNTQSANTTMQSSSKLLRMTSTLATPNKLFDCSSFSSFEMEQPFAVSLASNILMIMDFHCHLDLNEVVGYLGGRYDHTNRTLEVVEVFPCKCEITDVEQSKQAESEIKAMMKQKGLSAVGWYHSHPVSEPKPSQSDILCQRSYQEVSRKDTGEEPCIGIILSPNHGGLRSSPVTEFELFHVVMIEQSGLKASPMKLQFSVVWDNYLTQEVVDEMNSLSSYYKGKPCCPKFLAMWKGEMYFINKFKKSLSEVQPKFPEENSNQTFMTYIDQLLGSEFRLDSS